MKHFEIIIVGGGATGCSTLFHLAERGYKNCLLLEKNNGFGRGATGSWGSLVRIFHMNEKTTERASRSMSFFLDYEERVENSCHFNKLGSLYFIKKHELESFRKHLFALEASGLEFHLIEPVQGKKEFPDFNWYDDDLAIYEPHAGTACPWATTEGWIQYAASRGNAFGLGQRVVHIEQGGGRIKGVRTECGQSYSCDKLILAAGIWTINLVESIGSKVNIYPEVIQLNRFCRQHTDKLHPLFIDKSARCFGHRSFNGSFVGGYLEENPIESLNQRAIQHVSLRDANIAKHKLAQRLPWIKNATLEGGLRAIDSYTSSKMGLIEYDSVFDNLLISAGWSCGGFTTAPDNGKQIASLLID